MKSYEENKRKLLKTSPLFLFALLLMLSSCDVSKRITYFQDIQDQQTTYVNEQPSPEIRLRPEDKVSIIVNTKVPELTALFNLPYIARTLGSNTDVTNTAASHGSSGYIIKADGSIDFPVLGTVQAAGKTRDELAAYIKSELINRNLVNDPVVTVEFINLRFSVMGEVRSPGTYMITRDHITLLDALSMAGDLTIDGKRDNVLVLRPNASGKLTAYNVDMRSFADVQHSPAYYIHQNDYIYVEPNRKRANQSTVNANTVQSATFWISVVSFLASLATTISVLATK